jgi:hypothetical protein
MSPKLDVEIFGDNLRKIQELEFHIALLRLVRRWAVDQYVPFQACDAGSLQLQAGRHCSACHLCHGVTSKDQQRRTFGKSGRPSCVQVKLQRLRKKIPMTGGDGWATRYSQALTVFNLGNW